MKVKILNLFIFLLAFQSYSTERLEALDSTDTQSAIYQNMIAVFIRFNELWLDDIIKVNHCTTAEADGIQDKSYKYISSCLFFNTQFFGRQSQTFRVHTEIDDKESFDFVLQWSDLSKIELLMSLFRFKNNSKNIQITAVPPHTLSSVLVQLLEVPLLNTVAEQLFYLSQLEVDALNINIQPINRKEYVVHLSLFRESEEIYDVHFVTNYKKEDDFFISPLKRDEENTWVSSL